MPIGSRVSCQVAQNAPGTPTLAPAPGEGYPAHVAAIPPSQGLAQSVRGRRGELGINRTQLALRLGWNPEEARSGWSPRTVVRIEGGERGLRDDGEVVMMARALEISADDLLAAVQSGGWTPGGGRGPAAARRRSADSGIDLLQVLARLLEQQREQTALLQQLVAAVSRGGEPAPAGASPPDAPVSEPPARRGTRRRTRRPQGPG